MTWLISVNGQNYDKYESFSFSRDMKQNVGEFSIVVTDTSPRKLGVQANDLIRILLDNDTVFSGVVNKLSIKGGLDGRHITITGKDEICDLVDSSVSDKAKTFKGNVSLIQVCQSVIKSLGLNKSVIDTTKGKAGSKLVSNQKVSDAGEQAMPYLAKLAARHQVWLVADENGDLNIMRAGERQSDLVLNALIDGDSQNNVQDATLDIDASQIYNKVKVRGQKGVGYDQIDTSTDFEDVIGEGFDLNARPSRYLEIKANEVMTAADMKKRAIDEINMRKADAFIYTATVNSFRTQSKKIVSIGDVVSVNDDQREVFGKMILSSFNVSFDIDSGTSVDLTLAPIEAYQIVEIQPEKDKLVKNPKVKKSKEKSNA